MSIDQKQICYPTGATFMEPFVVGANGRVDKMMEA
jgi:hypothetical protein